MKRLCILVVVLFLASQAYAAQPPDKALVTKAQAEGKAAFYANITAVEPVMEAFTKAHGVKAEYTRISTTKFVATTATEPAAGKFMADVVQAPMPILEILKDKGILASYRSPMAASYPEWTRKDDKIQTFGIEYVALIYNKELVKPADVPKRYEDITDPKWRNKLVMADPTSHPEWPQKSRATWRRPCSRAAVQATGCALPANRRRRARFSVGLSWAAGQAMRAASTGKAELSAEAAALQDHFLEKSRQHHGALLAAQPLELLDRALAAMGGPPAGTVALLQEGR